MSNSIETHSIPFNPPDEEVAEPVVEAVGEASTGEVEQQEPEEETAEVAETGSVEDLTIQEKAQDVLAQAGLDMAALSQEYSENRALSDESYTKLTDAGFPKELVDQYISGQEALVAQAETYVQTTAYDVVGGKEAYASMTEWASSNLDEAQIQAFNESVQSMDSARAGLAVAGLAAQYKASVGSDGSMVSGTSKSSDTNDLYENRNDLMKDLANPEYQTSPSFRAKVDARTERTMQRNGGKMPI